MVSPKDILDSTTPQIKQIIENVFLVEKNHEYVKNLEKNKSLEKEIAEEISRIFDREVK